VNSPDLGARGFFPSELGLNMDSLFAKADALRPLRKRKPHSTNSKQSAKAQGTTSSSSAVDNTAESVATHTTLPRSLRPKEPLPKDIPSHAHIANKKLRTQLGRESAHMARSKALVQDAELLLGSEAGTIQVDGAMERTWRVSQDEITTSAGEDAARGRREWKLDGGPYRCRYTRNGRCVIVNLWG
jgi:U3 small nucleolar RNA-associated protein 7